MAPSFSGASRGTEESTVLTTSASRSGVPTSEDPYFRLDSEMFTKARGGHGDLRVFISPSHASHRPQYCLGLSAWQSLERSIRLGLGGWRDHLKPEEQHPRECAKGAGKSPVCQGKEDGSAVAAVRRGQERASAGWPGLWASQEFGLHPATTEKFAHGWGGHWDMIWTALTLEAEGPRRVVAGA